MLIITVIITVMIIIIVIITIMIIIVVIIIINNNNHCRIFVASIVRVCSGQGKYTLHNAWQFRGVLPVEGLRSALCKGLIMLDPTLPLRLTNEGF